MSINITIFLALLLLFVLQQNLESYQFNKLDSNELNENIRAKDKVTSSENNDQPKKSQEKKPLHNVDTHLDLAKKRNLSKKLTYRIAPQIPNFSSDELNWQKHELVLELFVNEHGDIERVLFESKNQTDKSDKIFQKLKPVFLKAKFYPYVENGRAIAFRIQQPIVLESSGKEPLTHKLFGRVFSEKER